MADEYDVTYNPTKVVAQMNEFVKVVSESTINYGDAFYEFSYNLSISWTSPMAKKYEEMMVRFAGFTDSTVETINYIIEKYEEGIAELTSVNDGDSLWFPYVPTIKTECFPMHETDSNGNVGIDINAALNAKDKYIDAFKEYALTFSTAPTDIGILDEEVREKAVAEMIETADFLSTSIDSYNSTLTNLLEQQEGIIDASEKMSYEALVEMASSMDTIPDDMPELKICKNWINTKEELIENVEKIKLETLGPDADIIMKELLHSDDPVDETSDPVEKLEQEEPEQEAPTDSSSNLHSPTSMPAKASLGNGPVSVLQ